MEGQKKLHKVGYFRELLATNQDICQVGCERNNYEKHFRNLAPLLQQS